MPLLKGSSPSTVKKNIGEFHTGKTYAHTLAKFGKKKANAQAVAVALSTARRSSKRYAEGGEVTIPQAARKHAIEKFKVRQFKPNNNIDPEMELDPESDYPIPSTPNQNWMGDDVLNGPMYSYGVRGPYAEGGSVDDDDSPPVNSRGIPSITVHPRGGTPEPDDLKREKGQPTYQPQADQGGQDADSHPLAPARDKWAGQQVIPAWQPIGTQAYWKATHGQEIPPQEPEPAPQTEPEPAAPARPGWAPPPQSAYWQATHGLDTAPTPQQNAEAPNDPLADAMVAEPGKLA